MGLLYPFLHKMRVVTFSTNLSEIFLVLIIIQRDAFIDAQRLFLYGFKKLELPRQIFEKCSVIKVHDNSSFENRVVQCRVTDRQKQRS